MKGTHWQLIGKPAFRLALDEIFLKRKLAFVIATISAILGVMAVLVYDPATFAPQRLWLALAVVVSTYAVVFLGLWAARAYISEPLRLARDAHRAYDILAVFDSADTGCNTYYEGHGYVYKLKLLNKSRERIDRAWVEVTSAVLETVNGFPITGARLLHSPTNKPAFTLGVDVPTYVWLGQFGASTIDEDRVAFELSSDPECHNRVPSPAKLELAIGLPDRSILYEFVVERTGRSLSATLRKL